MKMLSGKGKILMSLTCLLYAMQSVIIAALVYTNGKIIEFATNGDVSKMGWAVAVAFGISLLSYLETAAAAYTRLAYLSNGEMTMKSKIMKNILRRPLQSFRGENDAFYLNLMSTDVTMYRTDYLGIFPYLFSSAFAIISSAYVLWTLHIWLLAAALAVAVIPMAAIKPFATIEKKLRGDYSAASEKYTNVLKETIEGYEVVRTGNSGDDFQARHDNASENRQKYFRKFNFVSEMSFETLMSVAGLSNIVCLGIGGYLAVHGLVAAGMLFSASNYFTSLSNSFTNITDYIITIRSSKDVVEKLHTQSSLPYPGDSGIQLAAPTDISYENVSFSFGKKKLYDGFSHTFRQGGCYAVVGESGSGKSTMFKLLLKYFDNYEGNILLGGQNIKKLSENELYSKIGIITQTPYLFNATFYDNITLFSGNPKENSGEYINLLDDLNLTALAEQVGDVPLGDFGDNISGGERQRINIARTMFRKPEILIFDEPATGLDPENAALIDNFIFNHKEITRIVISHNWAEDYLSRFDEIIRL
ncbi:MAG: ABC transporter ATP-binding protein [Dorea sp.]|nr:ABC transporter ATP-binding protein [Dorea sp.]